MVETTPYTRNALIGSLLKMTHGKLEEYVKVGLAAAAADPDLFGHFITWNGQRGKVRDAKIAFAVLALRGVKKGDQDLAENAVANLLLLSPRDLVRAYDFSKLVTGQGHPIPGGYRRLVEQGLRRYLREREQQHGWWERTAVQHRRSLKRLYRLSHCKPSGHAQRILFKQDYPKGSVFAAIAGLHALPPQEAAGVILEHALPFEIIVGSVDVKNPDILLALIEGMTGNQVITNTKMLERLGVMKSPILKASYDAALVRAKSDTRVETLKAGRAAEATTDETVRAKLGGLQQHKVAQLGTIDGDWLVLGDRSGSMAASIEMSRRIAGFIAERVKGKVYLVFFNTEPMFFDVSGKPIHQIAEETKRISVNGGTSIGCGLEYVFQKGLPVQGIAIVSDGAENTSPVFPVVFQKYCEQLGVEPTTYLFKLPGQTDVLTGNCARAGIALETFEASALDYYALPQTVALLRTGKFSLYDDIMAVKLLTIDGVFRGKGGTS